MSDSFFFYDLETSGISAARDRIMQFGGQRTDLNLKPIGEPVNLVVSLTPDILPSPEAILLTGISPIDNIAEGITEAEFTKIFNEQIALPNTTFVGFNNLRFDDEFIRYINYRNFYDAYSWHWQDFSSRWDLLDVVRMTRALRPEGINWPFNDEGKPSNRLEHLTKANKLKHLSAHDAVSDAEATIDVAKLLKASQPKLFNYLLSLRTKTKVIEVIKNNEALVYTSSHYSSEYLHTTVVAILSIDQQAGSSLVYDLRVSADQFLNLSIDELAELWQYDPEATKPRLPVKTMKLNRCPAIAPLSVLDKASIDRLKLDMKEIEKNRSLVSEHKDEFASKLQKVARKLDTMREERLARAPRVPSVDERLYDKFLSSSETRLFQSARQKASHTNNFDITFSDKRLNELYMLYRARNYPDSLTPEEVNSWKEHVNNKLFSGDDSEYQRFNSRIKELRSEYKKDKEKLKLFDELNTYAQAILNDYAAD